ncbi:MAG: hypothetical protein ACM3IK_10375, partial [Sphingomonadaceae bacterium]
MSPWAPAQLTDGPERARLETTFGGSAAGEVLLLGADDGLFFKPEGGHKAYWIAISKVRSLTLTRPL